MVKQQSEKISAAFSVIKRAENLELQGQFQIKFTS